MSDFEFRGPYDLTAVETAVMIFMRGMEVETVSHEHGALQSRVTLCLRYLGLASVALSREEALEQMMEWCARELQKMRVIS